MALNPTNSSKSLKAGYKRVSRDKHLREYTYLGCPLTKNRSPWCFRMCKPNADGIGQCGRVAPHGFNSRIQNAIKDYNSRKTES